MKHANAARMTQVGQLDAEVPTLPDRFVPRGFVITTRQEADKAARDSLDGGNRNTPYVCFDIDSCCSPRYD